MSIIGEGNGEIYVVIFLTLSHQDTKTVTVTAIFISTITLNGAAAQYWKKRVIIDWLIALSALDIGWKAKKIE